jgi:hypothetical protein
MMSDIQVVGLVPETVSLADIGMDVPHGIVVRIPADKASNSKDLWRALNQHRIFRLMAGPSTPLPVPVPVSPLLSPRVEQELSELRAALAAKDQELQAERARMDEVLGLLRGLGVQGLGVQMAAPAEYRPRAALVALPSDVVEIETPTFIPSTIKGDHSDARVTVEEGGSEGGGVSDARSALRRLRRNE